MLNPECIVKSPKPKSPKSKPKRKPAAKPPERRPPDALETKLMARDGLSLGAARLKAARIRYEYKQEILRQRQPGLKRFWISWYECGEFHLLSPWYDTGFRISDGAMTVCAAVLAPSAEAAHQRILDAHVKAADPEWRFCEEMPADWTPPELQPWMVWEPTSEDPK